MQIKIGNQVKILQWGAHEYNLIPFVSQINFIRKVMNLLVKKFKFLSMKIQKN